MATYPLSHIDSWQKTLNNKSVRFRHQIPLICFTTASVTCGLYQKLGKQEIASHPLLPSLDSFWVLSETVLKSPFQVFPCNCMDVGLVGFVVDFLFGWPSIPLVTKMCMSLVSPSLRKKGVPDVPLTRCFCKT